MVQAIDSLTTPYDPDLAIDYAATVTWNGVIEITNAIGGVDVCVDGTIDDPEAGGLYRALVKTFAVTVEDGVLNLQFIKVNKGAIVSAIEVVERTSLLDARRRPLL